MRILSQYRYDVIGLSVYKLVQVLTTILITNILIKQFQSEIYALIVTLTSIAQFVMIDTGSGDSIKKRLLQDKTEINQLIINGFVITLVLSIIISCTMYLFTLDTAFTGNLNGKDVLIVLIVSTFIMPLKISREVFASYQKSYIHSFILIISALTSLSYFYIFKINSVLEAVLVQHGAILLGNLIAMIYLMYDVGFSLEKLIFSRKSIIDLLPDSSMFFLIGVSLMVINGVDILLLNYFGLSSDSITEISLIIRVCIYVHTMFMFFIYPSWPLLNALKKNDPSKYLDYRKILNLTIVFGGGFCSIVVFIYMHQIIYVWTKVSLTSISTIPLGFIFFTYLRMVADYFDYLLRSDGIVSVQAKATLFEAMCHVLFGYIGWKVNHLIGFSVLMPFSTLFCRVIPYMLILRVVK